MYSSIRCVAFSVEVKRLLVFRFSAMGDVALTVPAIRAVIRDYPDVHITLVSRPLYATFFYKIPNLTYFSLESKYLKRGLRGVLNLYSDLKSISDYDAVIDLHEVFRTKFLSLLFKMRGVPIFTINKERKEKRKLIDHKSQDKLKHTVYRYCDVFAAAGLPIVLNEDCKIMVNRGLSEQIISELNFRADILNIGVAPFALYKMKTWPEEYMIKLLQILKFEYKDVCFWLFGGREDVERLKYIAQNIDNSIVVAGKFNLEKELSIMKMLDFMIAMDSSNMHMASLVGTKVISIWGATDPLIGFGAWNMPDEWSIRIPIEEMTCRPCSIYGKGKCRKGDFGCMRLLTPEKVFEKIKQLLRK